jgi:hypothetical protein
MEQHLQIVRRNQEIIHRQRNEPLQEFPDIPVFPPIPNPYGSLTPAELAAFGIVPARVSFDDDDEAQADDDEEMEDDEYPTSLLCFIALFPFCCLDDKGGRRELSLLAFFFLVWLVIWIMICFMCGL